jgi:hypothetical protein
MRFKCILFVLVGSTFFSCLKKGEVLPVEKTSYTIEDENMADKSFKILRYGPLNDSIFYSAYYVMKYDYGSNVTHTIIHMMDEQRNTSHFLVIYSQGDLKYQTYQTSYTSNISGNKVYVQFNEKLEYGYTNTLMDSQDEMPGHVFKYEKLNAEYDLLTFDFGIDEVNGDYSGRFKGRFKIKF